MPFQGPTTLLMLWLAVSRVLVTQSSGFTQSDGVASFFKIIHLTHYLSPTRNDCQWLGFRKRRPGVVPGAPALRWPCIMVLW